MERIADNIISVLGFEKSRTTVELCKIKLGLEIVIHNTVMIVLILFISSLAGILRNATMLITAYGLLKVSAGGIHLKRSSHCIFCTLLFIFLGVTISTKIQIPIFYVVFLYFINIVCLYFIAPQGTKNNPITPCNVARMKWQSIFLVILYLCITIYEYHNRGNMNYLLLIATMFETCSLIPYYMNNRKV